MAYAKTATVAVVLALTTACSSGGTTPQTDDSLLWAVNNPPNSLDIAHGFNNASTLIQTAVLDTMVTLDARGVPAPRLATQWTQPDPATYLFTLRKGVRFADGTPLTADDAAFSLRRHLDPKVASQAASYFTTVKQVEAVGDDQVKVTLKRPNSAFLAMSAIAWQVTPRKLAEAHPQDLGSPEVGTMGTGPFKVTKFSLTSGVVLERNESYWGRKPALRRVEFKTITDPETLRLAVRSGEVDATDGLYVRDARKWTGLPGVKTIFYPGNNIGYLSLAVKTGPLKDLHVRRAIAYAINRKAVADLMTAGHGTPAATMLPSPQLAALYGDGLPALPAYPYDVQAAKAELAKSAHPQGFELEVPYASTGDGGTVMQAVASDLAKIGIKLILQPSPVDQYRARVMQHDRLSIQYVNLAYGTPDPLEVLPDMVSRAAAEPEGFNFSGYGTAATDKQLDTLASTTGQERKEQVTALLTEIAEQVPYIPLFYTDQAVALNEKFTGTFTTWSTDGIASLRPAGR
ncbi:peptide/nickel transport system substrate-binding protein [Streptosporangium becharense]|uniref:Peptide/nickel transport system substrate-binding protein n=1 Tax=Streptosporangium becharense TaxID=1816182 RepID=A0A7W9MEK0_9ACTN|nr:ABC transporter substrate-binding protein [Streptosporangium becharense]MBB2910714.1 peptide/nickel transport system substrate-binding protein [Streptosporangium becharense]MBB5817409.1 peptide/nickel transport system substrate-binding protein [Streptosporangium becharense]